jgi:hypothetical protein
MATKAQIKAAILKVAGDPVSGVIVELVDAFADAVEAIDNPLPVVQEKENRVTKPTEIR